MRIAIGSTNPIKIAAVHNIVSHYGYASFQNVEAINVVAVHSGVSSQPLSLGETIIGASNRAKAAFSGHDLSFGMESGFMPVPVSESGVMNICACVLYDGQKSYLGLSPAFECPLKALAVIRNKSMDFSQAFYEAGLTGRPDVGKNFGVVHLLTEGRIDRTQYTESAIVMAMAHFENKKFYEK